MNDVLKGMARWVRFGTLATVVLASACDDPEDGAFLDHEEMADFDPFDSAKADGVSSTFDRNNVVDDQFFTASTAIDATAIQAFLEATPYGKRCFLADEMIGSSTPAQAIADAAIEHGINPIMLLSRMQVEKGLISKSARPSQKSIDFAFGCGCPDGKACNEAFRGFDKQIACAAETMRKHYDAAEAGSGIWNVGVPKKSLDGLSVTPANAATASLYAYTPWVLVGKGGNWLVWNVTGKFVNHLDATSGVDIEPQDFIGSPCETTDAEGCGFSHDGAEGFCHAIGGEGDSAGVCSLDCEGLCPDRPGTLGADTMCVEIEPGAGGCMPVAGSHNADCDDIPGTEPTEMERFVGDSGLSVRMATVCMPKAVTSAPDGGPSCVGQCGDTSAQPDGNGNACFCDAACVAAGDCCGDFVDVCGG